MRAAVAAAGIVGVAGSVQMLTWPVPLLLLLLLLLPIVVAVLINLLCE
jgi:hypothetical protein